MFSPFRFRLGTIQRRARPEELLYVPVIGICAGYQMLGRELRDPDGVESRRAVTEGLGLLPTSTTFLREKVTHQVRGRVSGGRGLLGGCAGAEVTAYEIHMGVSPREDAASPFSIDARSGRRVDSTDGALDEEGLTLGTYLHGLFHNRALRRGVLEFVASRKGAALPPPTDDVDLDAEYGKLAPLCGSTSIWSSCTESWGWSTQRCRPLVAQCLQGERQPGHRERPRRPRVAGVARSWLVLRQPVPRLQLAAPAAAGPGQTI